MQIKINTGKYWALNRGEGVIARGEEGEEAQRILSGQIKGRTPKRERIFTLE